jgi:hypothetical protein
MAKAEQEQAVDVIARALVRRCRSATMASALTGRRRGWPYASLVSVACAADASPILLLSTLADHTRNLAEDPRASLLFEEASGLANPQTGPRVTLTGRLKPTTDPLPARRFLARHPAAELYAGFADFRFFRMKVERAHYVGGFGRANWMAAKKFLYDVKASDAVAAAEQNLIKALNREDAKILARLAGKPAKLCGIDPEGLDLLSGNTFRRVPFASPVRSGRGVRGEIEKIV